MTSRRFWPLCIALLPLPLAAQQPAGGAAVTGRIELVHELTIGADPSGPQYEFAALGSATAAKSGVVCVSAFDGRNAEIRRFDQAGRYRGTVGRRGGGPGEYEILEGLALVGDSLLVVFDAGQRRLLLFDTAGTYRSQFPVAGGAPGVGSSFATFADGTIGIRSLTLPRGSSYSATVATRLVRYSLAGDVRDSVAVPSRTWGKIEIGHRSLGRRTSFAAESIFVMLRDGGIALAHTMAYSILVRPAGGAPFTITRGDRPLPIEGRERADWEELAQLVPRSAGRLTIPRRKPLIRELLSDDVGRLWVGVYTIAAYREPSPRTNASTPRGLSMWEHNAYDVFDQRGRHLGRLDLKPFSKLLTIVGDRIWVSEETEDGGSALVRYRMSMPEHR